MTETRGFPELKPVDAPPELDRFATAVRRLQDLAVSTNPDGEVWNTATEAIERAALHWNRTRCPTATLPRAVPPSCPASAIR